MKLTTKQRAALVALADASWRPPVYLARELDTSAEGAAMTASSLVRRGLVERGRQWGLVVYRITRPGLSALRHHQQELTP